MECVYKCHSLPPSSHFPRLSSSASSRWTSFCPLSLPRRSPSSSVSLVLQRHPPHPLPSLLHHLTTRCGNPITHVRIPAGEEREGGREGVCGQRVTVWRPRVSTKTVGHLRRFFKLLSGEEKKILIDIANCISVY